MKKKILITTIFIGSLFSGYSFAQSSSDSLQTTAKLIPTCTMSAENVNFGVILSPLTAQSSNSKMNVLCNNNATFKIDLAYGGIYGAGSSVNQNYLLSFSSSYATYNLYSIYDKSNNYLGGIACGFSGAQSGQVLLSTSALAQVYGYSSTSWIADTKKVCSSDGTKTGTSPAGWDGNYNVSGKQFMKQGTGYSYGIMTGAVNNNSVAYSISLPNDSTKVWNNGNNSYSSTGTGVTQNIAINAKIVPGNSSSLFPAQDFYLDTVTAVIAF